MTTKDFILLFNEAEQKLQEVLHFGDDSAAALREYGALERKYRDAPYMDILLVGSDSLETVKLTHSTYFTGEAQKRFDDVFRSKDAA